MSIYRGLKRTKPLKTKPNEASPSEHPIIEGVHVSLNALIQWVQSSPKFGIKPNAKSISRTGGQYASNLRGRGVDFSEVRLYQAGDDIRSIDWRVTARTSKPHTKLYEEERERPIVIVADQSPSLFFGSQHVFKSYLVGQLAALLAYHAVQQGDRLGSLIFNHKSIHTSNPRRGQQQWQRFCQQLVDYNQALSPFTLTQSITQPPQSWTGIFNHLSQIARPGTLVIMISDFSSLLLQDSKEIDTSFAKLRIHNDLIAIHVSDPLEKHLPKRQARFTNGSEYFLINGQHKKTQKAFETQYKDQLDRLTSTCKKYSTPLIQVSTADNPLDIATFLDSRVEVKQA